MSSESRPLRNSSSQGLRPQQQAFRMWMEDSLPLSTDVSAHRSTAITDKSLITDKIQPIHRRLEQSYQNQRMATLSPSEQRAKNQSQVSAQQMRCSNWYISASQCSTGQCGAITIDLWPFSLNLNRVVEIRARRRQRINQQPAVR